MRFLSVLLLLVACSTSTSTPAPTGTSGAAPTMRPDAVLPGDVDPVTGKVAIAVDGTHLTPPVAVSEIPDGAYYCDMGTVHYARMDKGDGKCPVCGMDLSHKE